MSESELEQHDAGYARALETASELLGTRLEPFLEPGPSEPTNAADFARLARMHAFGDAWPRTEFLDTRTRALVSVAIAATLGTLQPESPCCRHLWPTRTRQPPAV
jgi:4-carboxymuconolactone decarboxylase